MNPSSLLRLLTACVLTWLAVFPAGASGGGAGVDRFNYILGTQTIGPAYQFTEKHPLLETAEVISNMGAGVIKFDLSKDYQRSPKSRPGITSLSGLAADEPSYRAVLDLPFPYTILWMSTFHDNDWKRGLSQQAAELEYREVYELCCHLLKTYSGTGKTFFLGHWEGDGMLRHSVDAENDSLVTRERVDGMIAWLNVRQKAVDDAKRDTAHREVQLWHYTEVNHVVLAKEQGRPALVNRVLPKVAVDYVSYSAYDTTNETDPVKIKAALDYIESLLPPNPEIRGKRVFIGEYGFPAHPGGTEAPRASETTNALSLVVMKAGIEWGCPFVLYWELYNNEVTAEGLQKGFWMIDDRGKKTPVYDSHLRYYAWARKFVAEHLERTGAVPDDAVFRKAAVAFLDSLTPEGK
jgi:hypothetical protein